MKGEKPRRMDYHTDGPIRTPPERVTTGLALILSEDFHPDAAEAARAELREHLKVDEPTFVARFSDDTNLASFIRVIGDINTWLPLSVPAAVYFSTIAKRAGDATWDSIRALLERRKAKSLADVATTLAATASKANGEVHIFMGLDVPDKYWGTCIFIRGRDPREIAHKMAAFVVHIEELETVMQGEIEAGRGAARRSDGRGPGRRKPESQMALDGGLQGARACYPPNRPHRVRCSRIARPTNDPDCVRSRSSEPLNVSRSATAEGWQGDTSPRVGDGLGGSRVPFARTMADAVAGAHSR